MEEYSRNEDRYLGVCRTGYQESGKLKSTSGVSRLVEPSGTLTLHIILFCIFLNLRKCERSQSRSCTLMQIDNCRSSVSFAFICLLAPNVKLFSFLLRATTTTTTTTTTIGRWFIVTSNVSKLAPGHIGHTRIINWCKLQCGRTAIDIIFETHASQRADTPAICL